MVHLLQFFLLKTHDYKNNGPCLSLSTIMSKKNFHLSAQFLQMIDLLLKFDCSSEEGSQGNKSVFQSS